MSSPLIHIGYYKTGSTWLQKEVFRPGKKLGFERVLAGPVTTEIVAPHDLAFEADAARKRLVRRFRVPLAEGRVPVLSSERFAGNLSLRLNDSAQIADRLAAVFPDGRVLIVVREQRAMILSTYRQYVMNGGMLSLEAYLAGGQWWWQQPFELVQYAYDRLIAHYHGRFGADHVLVLPFELFRRDGRGFVSRIVDFAGASAEPGALDALPFGAVVNATEPSATIAAKRQLNRFARQPLEPFEGGKLVRVVAQRAGRLVPTELDRRLERRMRDAVAHAVGDYYRESNARTSELIGIDLAEYGYDVR